MISLAPGVKWLFCGTNNELPSTAEVQEWMETNLHTKVKDVAVVYSYRMMSPCSQLFLFVFRWTLHRISTIILTKFMLLTPISVLFGHAMPDPSVPLPIHHESHPPIETCSKAAVKFWISRGNSSESEQWEALHFGGEGGLSVWQKSGWNWKVVGEVIDTLLQNGKERLFFCRVPKFLPFSLLLRVDCNLILGQFA
jgi:hypothetical protein